MINSKFKWESQFEKRRHLSSLEGSAYRAFQSCEETETINYLKVVWFGLILVWFGLVLLLSWLVVGWLDGWLYFYSSSNSTYSQIKDLHFNNLKLSSLSFPLKQTYFNNNCGWKNSGLFRHNGLWLVSRILWYQISHCLWFWE